MNLTVYCGGNDGDSAEYAEAAAELGTILARDGITLVYGGGGSGIMGAVARSAVQNGGKVIGIFPEFMRLHEQIFEGATEQIIVKTMAERKAKLAELADGYIILPGGIGTMEEFFEIISARKLGLHSKPIVIVNTKGYWNPLLDLLDQMADRGFTSEASIDLCHWSASLSDGMDHIKSMIGN
ncbi:MAG: TIGR00730 family Rossman fold protein [Candidatus Pacebacteria bacterium]|nr:TIGR00730 family Rossman fold protein [Candidatus Paceibacterota bacterium]